MAQYYKRNPIEYKGLSFHCVLRKVSSAIFVIPDAGCSWIGEDMQPMHFLVQHINSIQQGSSWEADSFSASKEEPCCMDLVCWTRKCMGCMSSPIQLQAAEVHYRAHNSPSPVPILSQMNPVRDIPSYLFKTHFNIIPQSRPRSSYLNIYQG